MEGFLDDLVPRGFVPLRKGLFPEFLQRINSEITRLSILTIDDLPRTPIYFNPVGKKYTLSGKRRDYRSDTMRDYTLESQTPGFVALITKEGELTPFKFYTPTFRNCKLPDELRKIANYVRFIEDNLERTYQRSVVVTCAYSIAKSLRAFIHANKFAAADLQQLREFLKDLLSRVNSWSNSRFDWRVLYSPCEWFITLQSSISQAIYHNFLEILFNHILSSADVILVLFEYLMGYIERGGWATYSDTSWEFRATYVSIELRLAAYFWFKFRASPAQPSSSERGRKRSRAELKGTPSVSERNERNKFEPRLKAKVHNGDKRMVSVWLGEYDTPQEAVDVYWIGAYYYNRWDRINNDILSWCRENLPPIAPNLAVEEKRNVVRRHAGNYLIQRCVGFSAEPGHVDPVVTPGTVEGGVLSPNDVLLPSLQPDSTGIGLGQRDNEGNITIEDYSVGDCSTRSLVEVFGQGGGSGGLNLPGSYQDINASQQQGIQDLHQSCNGASALEGGGAAAAEVGGIMTQDQTDPGASVEHYQARSGDVSVIVSGTVEGGSQEGFYAEPHQGAGYGDPVTEPRTVEGGGLPPTHDSLQSPPLPPCGFTQCVLDGGDLLPIENLLQSPLPPLGDVEFMLREITGGVLQQADSTGIDMTQRDLEDVSADDYFPGSNSTPDGASGHGLGNKGQNSLRTCRDLSIYNQQDVQHLQQNHEGAIDLEGGDAPEAEAILQQDETEGHLVLWASANHTQAVPSPADAPELKTLEFTDTIQSMSQELYQQGWGFRTRFRHSDSCSVAFSRCEGREGPLLTGPIISTFKEIHGQGFDIILEPTIGNASAQDGKAQSRAGSRDLCGNCQARLCRNCTAAE